jgi:branched-chain amino acid transport system substrate-binding protein
MRLRLLIALLSVFALVVAACSSDDDDTTAPADDTEQSDSGSDDSDSGSDDSDSDSGSDDSDSDDAEPEAPAGCAANTPDDVPGIDKEAGVIKLGTSQPFTGRAAVAGEGLLGGLFIAIAEINAAGGVDGCTFELVWEDDRLETEQMVINVRKMIDEDQVWGFLGTAGSGQIPATYPALEAAGTPLWGPVSPADQDIKQVYLTSATRTEQGRICLDYFAEQGVTTVATIGQDNELGEEANAALDLQAPVHGFDVVAREEVEAGSDLVAPAVLSVVESQAEGVLTALDGTQNALVFDQFLEAGFSPLICSDGGSAGAGGATTVSLANPEAVDGYLGALQHSLTDDESPFVQNWAALWEAYDGPGAESLAPNFSLQTYSIANSFFQLWDRLDGDYSYDNFHAQAEKVVDDPIIVPSGPPIVCGPLPGGHNCASGAGLARYDAFDDPDGDGIGTWTQVRAFQGPAT